MGFVPAHDDELLAVDGPHVETVVVDRQHDKRRLEPAGAHAVGDERRVLANETEPDVGVAPPELGRELGDEIRRRGPEHPEADRASAKLANIADSVARVVEGCEDALRLGAKRPPGSSEGDAATDAREQLDAELRFELPHLLGERRLGDEERARCGGERAVVGSGEEVAKLLEIHRLNL